MPKFNVRATIGTGVEGYPDRTENYEGAVAFKTDMKTELTLRFLTYLVGEPKFYTPNAEDETETIRILISSIAEEDPEYLMKLATYTRNEMYLRSAPLFMLVESVQYDDVKPFVKDYTPSIIRRADELTEVIAYFINKHGEIGSGGKASLPNSLKKGIAKSFYNFDAYQFAKYDRDGTVKLKDVLRLTHPKPRNEAEAELFRQIRDRELPIPDTWETVISTQGSNKETWESIIPQMGYMAKLRNLRNFLKVDVDVAPVIQHLTNPKAVKNSKQFPFRFYSAYKIMQNETTGNPFDRQAISNALEQALELSVENLPKLEGDTFITSDESGSMHSSISSRSIVEYIDIANVMGALAHKISKNAIASVFGRDFSIVPMNPNDSILTNTNKMSQVGQRVGHSTNAFLALQWLNEQRLKVDRIMIFSDMQCYSTFGDNRWGFYQPMGQSLTEQFTKYKRTINPNVRLYSFDLTGYGTVQFPQDEPNIMLLAGWSDRVLEFIHRYENFGSELIGTIENYNPLS